MADYDNRITDDYDKMIKDANEAHTYEAWVLKGRRAVNIVKASITVSYIGAFAATCGAVLGMAIDKDVFAAQMGLVDIYFLAGAILGDKVRERAESRLAEAEKKVKASERNSLEAKLKAKRESERLEDMAILSSSKCEIKYK